MINRELDLIKVDKSPRTMSPDMVTVDPSKLMDLPDEILLMVIASLDVDSLLDAVYVSKRFRELVEPFIYESITILHGEKALNLSHSLIKDRRRPSWVRTLLISTKFGQEHALKKLPPSISLMDNLQDLRLETPDCNNKKPEDRVSWIELQNHYEKIFRQSSVMVPDRDSRLLPNLRSCVLHFVDTHTELYSMSRYSSIFLHPTLKSLTISCMSTNFPETLFRDVPDINQLKRSTALEYLHLEECDLHPPSLELILSFPRALKSLKISEGIRYDGVFRAGSSRLHGNVKPGPFAQALVDTCKDSLESLSLALGYIRSHGQEINHKQQHLKLVDLDKLKHLEVNNRTLNLIRDRPACDHGTWKRLPPSLESLKVFAVPLMPPQHDARQPYVPLQSCIVRDKRLHGLPRLNKVVYSYEHYESTDDEEMNFNDLLMNLVHHEANGNPPVEADDAEPNNPAPHANPILNLLQQAVGVINPPPAQAPAPAPASTPAPATTNTTFITAAMNPNLEVPPHNIQPPRFRWRTPGLGTAEPRVTRSELSRSDGAKLGLLNMINDTILSYFNQSRTRLQIDLVTLPRGFIPPYLFPEDKPKTQEAWFDSEKPLTPTVFIEGIKKAREAARAQINRSLRRTATRSLADQDRYDSEQERSRNRFMRRMREEELGAELVPGLDGIGGAPAAIHDDVDSEDEEEDIDDDDDDEMEVEDMLEMLAAEAAAGQDTTDEEQESDSAASGSLYVDATDEVEMSEVDSGNEYEGEDEDEMETGGDGGGGSSSGSRRSRTNMRDGFVYFSMPARR